jgi:hypothetical protein
LAPILAPSTIASRNLALACPDGNDYLRPLANNASALPEAPEWRE